MIVAKQLLLNLSLLLVFLFIFQIWHERKGVQITKFSLNIYFTASLLLCFALSTQISSEFVFDLRHIPLILISLYSGIFSGFGLLFLTLILRFLIGGIDFGFWFNVINFTALITLTGSLHSWFIRQSSKKKMIISVLCSISLTVSWLFTKTCKEQIINFDFWLSFIIIPMVGTLIITYTIESVISNYKLKEKLINSEKMEAVSQLSASISHEVRNPHCAVRGFIQIIKEDPTLSVEKRNEFLTIALSELDRAEHIISDYLTFAKPTISNMSVISLNEVLNGIIQVITPMANMNNVSIETDFDQTFFISGDKSKLQQALMNIMKNSIEAMPSGGRLTIQLKTKGKRVSILVSDTGMGMSKEQLKRLGEPYFSTKGTSGTGLGMMVTFSVVKAMKGKMEVKSEVHKGSTFNLSFPMIEPGISPDA